MACLAQNVIECFQHWQRIWRGWRRTLGCKVQRTAFPPPMATLASSCLCLQAPVQLADSHANGNINGANGLPNQQYFRRHRPPIPLAANGKLSSPQEVFSWKLIIKYHHLPHPCSYCPLGKNSKERNFWVDHFCCAHRGVWVAFPISPKSIWSTSNSGRDTNTATSETRVPHCREFFPGCPNVPNRNVLFHPT